MVATKVLRTFGEIRGGSSPSSPTKHMKILIVIALLTITGFAQTKQPVESVDYLAKKISQQEEVSRVLQMELDIRVKIVAEQELHLRKLREKQTLLTEESKKVEMELKRLQEVIDLRRKWMRLIANTFHRSLTEL